MRKNPRRILSPQRLPFRHPGIGRNNKINMYDGDAQIKCEDGHGPSKLRVNMPCPTCAMS